MTVAMRLAHSHSVMLFVHNAGYLHHTHHHTFMHSTHSYCTATFTQMAQECCVDCTLCTLACDLSRMGERLIQSDWQMLLVSITTCTGDLHDGGREPLADCCTYASCYRATTLRSPRPIPKHVALRSPCVSE